MSVSTPSWIDAPVLGFDTEPTGTNVAADRIVTVALVHSVGPGRENETVATWLIDPEMDIPEPAQRVHGISTEHARAHGMRAADALDERSEERRVGAECGAEGAPCEGGRERRDEH